jgi:hypothetical protein
MSLNQLIREHVTTVFLNTAHFAETVIRYAGGAVDRQTEITAIVTWMPSDVSESRGKGYLRKCEMLVSDSVTITPADAFKIGDTRCEVTSIDNKQDGSRVVHLQQYESEAKGIRKAGDI